MFVWKRSVAPVAAVCRQETMCISYLYYILWYQAASTIMLAWKRSGAPIKGLVSIAVFTITIIIVALLLFLLFVISII